MDNDETKADVPERDVPLASSDNAVATDNLVPVATDNLVPVKKDEEEEDFNIEMVGSDFFDDYELANRKEKHYNLIPDMAHLKSQQDRTMSLWDTEVDTSQVLGADHPLLERFQRSLKEQLTKRIFLLSQDVAELEEGCRTKNNDKEMIGMEAYETQQTCNKQQETIEVCLKELDSVAGAREEIDLQLITCNDRYAEEKSYLIEAETEEIQVRNELESIDLLLSQMRQWEEEMEGELLVNQRILDNTERFKTKLYSAKREQDTIIFNLMNIVWKLESELETMLMQLRVKEEDRERLAEAVALANIDIEANQSEHRALLHGWQAVLVTITQRDKYYNQLQVEFSKYDDKLSTVNCELMHVKREIQKEHLENERLTLIKERLEFDYKNAGRTIQREMERRTQLLKVMSQYDKVLNEHHRKKEQMLAEMEEVKQEEEFVTRELEKSNAQKFQLEQDIMMHLQASAFNSDACRQMTNVLKDVKEENRRMRINIAKVEGQISIKHAEWQTRRLENSELSKQLRDLKAIMTEEDGELGNINKEYLGCEKELTKLIAHYEILKQKTADDAAQKLEMWPQEVRIRQLEATINDIMDRNRQSQSFWLREQAIVVDLSEKRQIQIKDMDVLKKQIRIMDQKNLRINDSLEELARKEEILNRSINTLENKLYMCTSQLNKKKDNKMAIDLSNNKIQIDLITKLEEAEFQSLKLKAEITEIEEDKMVLSKELVEKNREALAWEKKLIMILDARKQMHDSQSESGDISQMKCEIHRMNVRYSHLRKAQEKLIHDLDNCVYRRDSIVTLAEARTRGQKGGSQQWRINFNKRRDDVKHRMAKIENEFSVMDKKIENKMWEADQTTQEINLVKKEVDVMLKHVKHMQGNIDKARLDRQLNLDILLFKQRKLKTYVELARGRSPYICFKTPAMAHNAYVREREMNAKLRRVVENLQTDLPQHITFLTKLHNSLVLPAITI